MARDRRGDEDDRGDERPARRRRDDDEYEDQGRGRGSSGQKGPLDGTFGNTNVVVLVLFGLCCGIIAFILALVGMLTAKDPKAKSNATLVLIISGIMMAIGIILQVTGVIAGMGAR